MLRISERMTKGWTGSQAMLCAIILTLLPVSGSVSGPTTPVVYTYYANKLLTWYEAAQYCHDQNGFLATIPNEMADSALQQRLETSRAWIGLHKTAAGYFMWLPDCLPVGDYNRMSVISLASQGDVCSVIKIAGNSYWSEWYCRNSQNFICENLGDECYFVRYENKVSKMEPYETIDHNSNETLCKSHCLSFDVNSLECIGFTYSRDTCDIYAGVDLSVNLSMVEASKKTLFVKTCYSVQVNADVISGDIEPNISKCVDAPAPTLSTDVILITTTTVDGTSVSLMTTTESILESSSQYDVSMITESTLVEMKTETAATSAPETDVAFVVDVFMTTADVSMTTEIASNTLKMDNIAILATTVELTSTSPTSDVDEWMKTTRNRLESSEQEHVSMTTVSPRMAMESATTVNVTGLSSTFVEDLMTAAANNLESSAQYDVSVTTESISHSIENVHTAISATTVDITNISATSVLDDFTLTTETSLVSSTQHGVSTTTETATTTPKKQESRSITYSCMCRCRRSTNTSMRTEEITKALMVKKTSLSSFRRSKESAKDERPSAQAVGQVGVVLLIVAGVAILLFDADVLIRFGKALFDRLKALSK